jgi:hypothetical protein
MKLRALGIALIFTCAPAVAVLAQSAAELASKIINDPGNPNVNGARAKLVDDPNVQGGKALQVIVSKKGVHDWDSSVDTTIKKPIKAGDHLILAFQAKLVSIDGGGATATLPYNAVQMNGAPYTTVISGSATVGPEWSLQKIEGTAAKDFAPGDIKTTMQLGNARQTIELGPVMLFDMGQ